jgi:hypothetical protein
MDSLASGVVFASAVPPFGVNVPADAPVVREVVEDWFRQLGGRLSAAQFVSWNQQRWEYTDAVPAGCVAR